MTTITRTIITVDVTPQQMTKGTFAVHEALLDGDEDLQVGSHVFVHDGDVTYLSATVAAHDCECGGYGCTETDPTRRRARHMASSNCGEHRHAMGSIEVLGKL